MGDEHFVPVYYRTLVFEQCLQRPLGETFLYPCPWNVGQQTLRVIGLEIDPRFGRIALVQSIGHTLDARAVGLIDPSISNGAHPSSCSICL